VNLGDIAGNGGIQVPNLAALNQQVDPSSWARDVICGLAGIQPGGRARIEVASGPINVTQFEVGVLAIPPMLHIFLGGLAADTGSKVMIPYHAVLAIRPGSFG
jgi:hypothetical protein